MRHADSLEKFMFDLQPAVHWSLKCRAVKRSTMVRTSLYKYKKVNLLIDKHNKGKKHYSV
jgi:hypothetical protein